MESHSGSAFGLHVRKQREALGLTRKELAHLVGCSMETIRKIESGERHASMQIATLLAHHLAIAQDQQADFIRSALGAPNQSFTPGNLPISLTSFVGRRRELAEVQRLLGTTRLLTLIGSGGCGKTRLSLQASSEISATFEEGVWLVELAALNDPALVTDTVARVFNLNVTGCTPVEALCVYLRNRQVLLILDNCEHMISVCATLAERLLHACPGLRMLATSREPLNVPGETIWRVPELAPDDAMLLFAERARAVKPEFALTGGNTPIVEQLCARLDGMPLAIELAAVRLKGMTLDEITARLDDRFRLLTSGSRTALPRHQALRAAIDWSYGLLSEPECAVLRRLSVFAGGFQAGAAEAICADSQAIQGEDVLTLLLQLVDKSLVQARESGAETRYSMLESIRQYGHEKLIIAGEYAGTRARHMAFFGQLSSDAVIHLRQPEQVSWMKRLVADMDNIRAGLDWAERTHDASAGVALLSGMSGALALTGVWYWLGYFDEGVQWVERVILGNPRATPHERLFGLTSNAQFRRYQGQVAQSLALFSQARALAYQLEDDYYIWRNLTVSDESVPYQKALELARQSGDPWRIGLSIWTSGLAAMHRDEMSEADELLAEAQHILESYGDRVSVAGLQTFRIEIALDREDYTWAHLATLKCLSIWRDLDPFFGTARLLRNLAVIHLHTGNLEAAKVAIHESIPIMQRANPYQGLCLELVIAAHLARSSGDIECGIRLAAAADQIRARVGLVKGIEYRLFLRQFEPVTSARTLIGEAKFYAAWSDGLSMTLDEAVEDALKL